MDFKTNMALYFFVTAFPIPYALANQNCKDLEKLTLESTQVTNAEFISEKSIKTTNGSFEISKPFCRISATIKPTAKSNIRIEVWMPPKELWNGKYLGTGNGGGAGRISHWSLAQGIRDGYATANTDMGSSINNQPVGFAFGINNPEKIIDWAYRSTHLMTLAAKKIIESYYKQETAQNYFSGCSTGGHQAIAEALKYPSDYDGIIAAAPGNNRLNVHLSIAWTAMSLHDGTNPLFPKDKLPLLNNAVLKACDNLDGVPDGIIDDPRICHFDPIILECEDKQEELLCLTRTEVKAIQNVYSGPTNPRNGEKLYPGYAKGGELGLTAYLDGTILSWITKIFSWNPNLNLSYTDASFRDKFDFDKDFSSIYNHLADTVNFTEPDLTEFKRIGGKIILYSGWSDNLTQGEDTANYFDNIISFMGGPERTKTFARLFMVPGMQHCSGGNGPNNFDMLAVLDDWVTKGKAPNRVVASKYLDNNPSNVVTRTRPLCPYPEVARWNGKGSTDSHTNFNCVNLNDNRSFP